MDKLKQRDEIIDTIISNLIMAGILYPSEVAPIMTKLASDSEDMLADMIEFSQELWEAHLFTCWGWN